MIHKREDHCKVCKHYLNEGRCRAFLGGIPDVLWSGENLHREPFEGDGGIRYTQRHTGFPDAAVFLGMDAP